MSHLMGIDTDGVQNEEGEENFHCLSLSLSRVRSCGEINLLAASDER